MECFVSSCALLTWFSCISGFNCISKLFRLHANYPYCLILRFQIQMKILIWSWQKGFISLKAKHLNSWNYVTVLVLEPIGSFYCESLLFYFGDIFSIISAVLTIIIFTISWFVRPFGWTKTCSLQDLNLWIFQNLLMPATSMYHPFYLCTGKKFKVNLKRWKDGN